jgi:hypothetical protein
MRALACGRAWNIKLLDMVLVYAAEVPLLARLGLWDLVRDWDTRAFVNS